MKRVRIAVVGVGHLGRSHVRLLAQHPMAEVVAAADVSEAALAAVREAHGVAGVRDYRELLGKVDAVCVVVPTKLHREVAGFFLEHGIDVLVEKPIAPSVAEAEQLVALAESKQRILQVGHVERFNPVLRSLAELGMRPRYVEAERVAPFSFRSTDIGVVLDLMIHDIDLVLGLMGQEVQRVEAFGGAVFTPAEDLASATLRFAGGGVAHLTASRVALKPARKMRVFAREGYASLDFQRAHGVVITKKPGWELSQLDVASIGRDQDLWKLVFEGLLQVKEHALDAGNPLNDELTDFLTSVTERRPPVVDGRAGCAAVAVAARVLESIAANRW